MTDTSKDIRVLVVDDSPTSLKFTVDSLSKAGFQTEVARDGDEATSLAVANQPDVIVLDIILPKKNGFQVCRELKAHPKTRDARIVLLSSKSREADRFWGQSQGADAYLTKPYEPAALNAIVRAVAKSDSSDDPEPLPLP